MIVRGGMSASSLKTYLTCPMKYFYTYEQGYRQSAEHLSFGTLCHTCLERWLKEDADIMELYKEEWAKSEMISPTYYDTGKILLNKYVAGTNKEEILNIGTEIEFNLEIAPEIFIKGFMDRVDVIDGDTIEVVDYKTSFIALTSYEIADDVQLSMYDLAASILFPEYANRLLSLEYLRHSKVSSSRSEERRVNFTEWLIDMYYKITNDNEPHAKLNEYCNWCMCKDQCEAYQAVLKKDVELDELGSDFTNLWEEKASIDFKLKILDGRRDKVIETLKNEFEMNQRELITLNNGSELYLTSQERHSYPIESIIAEFPDNWKELVSVRKTEADKRASKEQKQRLSLMQDTYYVEPTLRARKIKGGK